MSVLQKKKGEAWQEEAPSDQTELQAKGWTTPRVAHRRQVICYFPVRSILQTVARPGSVEDFVWVITKAC